MPRVRLASWYDGHAPGDVIEVADEQVRPLTRDGRVAEVLTDYDPATEMRRGMEYVKEQYGGTSEEPSEADPQTAGEPSTEPPSGLPRRRRKAEG